MKRNVKLFINDILENINDIESFSKGMSKSTLKFDLLRQKAIIRSLEVIGEASKNIPESFRKEYPQVPWRDIAGFRDVMIHGYFRIDLDKVWNIIKMDIPDLKEKISNIKVELEK
ncbi:MAG: DUF86 domain-containing protein [archaeon]